MGAVTSLSCDVPDLWSKLLAGASGIHGITGFDTTDYKVRFAGEVHDWAPDDFIEPREQKRIDRFTQFALVAGINAVRQCGIEFDKEDSYACGAIIGSGIGGVKRIEGGEGWRGA